MAARYRPQFLWLLMGPMIGAFSGAVVGTLLIWSMVLSDSGSWSGVGVGLLSGVYLGGVYGGICGVVVGFVASTPLVFLVGRHLPRTVARRRAHALGALLPPLAMLGLGATLLDLRLSGPGDGGLALLLVLAAAALMGSRLAGWLAGMDGLPRPVGTVPCTDTCCSPPPAPGRPVS